MKAFPVEYYGRGEGMDLRDYFAAAALQGFLATKSPIDLPPMDVVANSAYAFADAMMEAREQDGD